MSASGRKRARVKANDLPFVQLSSRMCGCNDCWKKPLSSSSSRHSTRLAQKKSKGSKEEETKKTADHVRVQTKNEIVYEGKKDLYPSRCSSDGRYLIGFLEERDLVIVDLVQNTQKVLKPREEWAPRTQFFDFVVLNSTTILLTVYEELSVCNELCLLRLFLDEGLFDQTFLYHPPSEEQSTFVLTEITGRGVEVKRAVLNSGNLIVFLRLNIDDARVTLDTPCTSLEEDLCSAHLTEDGRELYAMDYEHPNRLHVYLLEQRKWTEHGLNGEELPKDLNRFDFFWSPKCLYMRTIDGGELFRCGLNEKKWAKVPIDSIDLRYAHPITNPEDGQEDGLVFIKQHESDGDRPLIRYKISRHMFRSTDSLRLLSLIALRKSREGVEGEKSFREEMRRLGKYKRILPSLYEGMRPIPVRRLQ